MNKGLTLFMIMSVFLLLAACNTGDNNVDDGNGTEDLEKAEKVEVISTDGSEVITSFSSDKDIKKFIDALKLDDWKSADIPSEATKGKTFKMYQEDTVKFGESGNEQDLNEIANMTTYKDDPYVEFSLKGHSFSFKVPNDVSEHLNDYK